MALVDQIQEFLQRLTAPTRGNLLTELERLQVCGAEIDGAAPILEKLRAEFRKDGSTQIKIGNPSRYFFAPLEPLLVEGDPEHANSGRISRGSLAPIWEWINRDLLPTMTRDYVKSINELIATNRESEARSAAATFQTKVVKSLENTLGSPDAAAQARTKLATYTASRSVYGDVSKIASALRARDALAKFDDALPAAIAKFDDVQIAKITSLLNAFANTHANVLAFALALVARRLKPSWQLIRLATKAAPGKNAADIAATPYALTVSMVLDRLDDRHTTLRVALKNNRVLIAKELLNEIYDTEYALRDCIDQFDQSEWGQRLNRMISAVAALVEQEISRFPDNVGHVLGSRRLRSDQSLSGRLNDLASKGRGVLAGSATFYRKLVGPARPVPNAARGRPNIRPR